MAAITIINIEEHAEHAATQFVQLQPKYGALASEIHKILIDSFQDHGRDCKIHKIEFRAKDVDSFKKKCKKTSTDGSPKYIDPLTNITDLAGVRVILFFPDDISKICSFIEGNFNVIEKRDVGEDRFATSGSFGYNSIHYLVNLKDDWVELPHYSKYKNMTCEIQVRTILQHAWAEMEHDIQYKSEQSLPLEIRRKFTALAGMLEIADREFQSVQREDGRLRSAIKKSLEAELTLESIPPYPIADAELPQAESLGPPVEIAATPAIVRARDLIITGDFARAVEVYSERISKQPNAHTLYLGRAKARFLDGDREGALEDIAQASDLNPEDSAVSIARSQIESGNVATPANNYEKAQSSLRIANEALSRGDGKVAFANYSDAQSNGHNYAFSLFNKAMSLAFVRDTTGARQILAELRPTPSTPMEINCVALVAILNTIDEEINEADLESVRARVGSMPDYTFALSPLRYFEQGLIAQKMGIPEGIETVFSLLKRSAEVKAWICWKLGAGLTGPAA
jgi:ppGpp synthetase/RelA/SpoT-type nucleotidyltranferase/Flp pilus assembly protein TadD